MEYNFYELVISVIIIVIVLGYYRLTSTHDFWSSRSVRGPKPSPLFGNFMDIALGKKSLNDLVIKEYKTYENDSMYGLFAFRTPMLVIKDPELIKDVLIKDFTLFSDRGIRIFEKVEPLSLQLFNLEPERWRPLRAKLSPIFTSGKLKNMFPLLTECAEHFESFLSRRIGESSVIECSELTSKFTIDVIGVCAFGLQINSLSEEGSKFEQIGRHIFKLSWVKFIRFTIRDLAPTLYQLLKPLMYERETNDFFFGITSQSIEHRKCNKNKRNDFIDLLIDIKNDPSKVDDIELTDELITAQVFVFFAAGFETSSTAISHALYELAQNHSMQNKLRQEINEELVKNNGELKYESIKDMKYLHKVTCETLRKYPPGVLLYRQSTASYTFSGTKVSIPKGTRVFIPVYAIHRDPKNYPDPDVFDPERFDDANTHRRHPSSYLPFGDGPRNCIGARFAYYQTRIGLLTILKNFRVDVCDKTSFSYVIDPKCFALAPIDGITLKFTKIH